MKEVQYLGYQVSSSGFEPLAERIQPVMDAPAPPCVSEIKVVLGYAHVLQLVPAEREYRVGATSRTVMDWMEWEWNTERDRAFKATKEMLEAASVLTHYNPSKPMV